MKRKTATLLVVIMLTVALLTVFSGCKEEQGPIVRPTYKYVESEVGGKKVNEATVTSIEVVNMDGTAYDKSAEYLRTKYFDLVIPSKTLHTDVETKKTNEYVVVGINAEAFKDQKMLKSVTIPETVEFIGESAFGGCFALCAVEIVNAASTQNPSALQTIESKAFQGCYALTSFVIPANVLTIADDAFADCDKLMQVTSLSSIVIHAPSLFNDYTEMRYNFSTKFKGEIIVDDRYGIVLYLEGEKADAQLYLLGYTTDVAHYKVLDLSKFKYIHRYSENKENISKVLGIKSVWGYAFYGATFETVILPQQNAGADTRNVGQIEAYAFANCQYLTKVDTSTSTVIIPNAADDMSVFD